MNKSLPTIAEPYQREVEANNSQMEKVFKSFFPNFPIFNTDFEELFKIINYLEETNVNPAILPRVIRGVHNIMIGTGKGRVIVHVVDNKVNVAMQEDDREISANK